MYCNVAIASLSASSVLIPLSLINLSAYFNASEIQNFSTVASLEQIANYNYNLNISLYANALNNENNFNVLSVSETLSNWKSVHAEMTSSITEMFTLIGK